MQRIVFAIALFAAASSASANPVYLDCETRYMGDPPEHFSVTLDEASGKVSSRDAKGRSFTADAVFNADTVSYQQGGCLRTCVVSHFEINRVNLAMHRWVEVSALDVPGGGQVDSWGKCALQATPTDRQF